jgi:hypothetical protein
MKNKVRIITACVATVAFCAPAASAGDKKKSPSSRVVGTSPKASANAQTTTKQKTVKTEAPQLKTRDLKSSTTTHDLKIKGGKIDLEKQKIGEMKVEAGER